MSSIVVSEKSVNRVRSLSEVQAIIAAWQASGLTQSAWCRANGIAAQTLQWYCRRVGARKRMAFIPIREQTTPTVRETVVVDHDLCLELGGDLRVTGLRFEQILALVRGCRAEVVS